MSSWQTVYKSDSELQVQIVKDVLENAGYNAVVINLKDHAYKIGMLEVRVSPDAVIPAIKLINEEIKFGHE
ncbi:hypothetical protein BXY85_2277 [Roseivirga pacifica]|uniref:DUF2007 domain-containing protein n=1 Tax=Roseivirga pacifica TaxID=1267423 RepID=A0A1I0NJY0_9BACT|nr:hypothetical protein [Roseivirga pacifica]MCO6359786.1 hypothetical protein [Roseivirga pacifica]MCO6367156.1 hypothetical protein [Roseivirga pacifica]MCO6370312.1 hypothetical protein [Roseivirga pacifica]MCO6374813.1 hypothetical protein [Roseivirga pacifica]MCO6380071.1 hypothetical protein [Roseivirga pacifica]